MLIGMAQVVFLPLHVPLHPAVKSSWLYNLLQQPAACWNNRSLSMQSMLTSWIFFFLSLFFPFLMRKFAYLDSFEGSLSHDYNSLLFIYLARKRHVRGWLPCGTITIWFSLPFCWLPHTVLVKRKEEKAFVLLVPLCWATLVVWSVVWVWVQAQGVGVRGSFAFSSQGSRVCLLQESEKALLVLLFFFPFEQIWRGNAPSPQGWLWMCRLCARTQELLSQEAPGKVRAPGEGEPLSSRDTPPYCYFKKLRNHNSKEFGGLWLLREFLKTGL